MNSPQSFSRTAPASSGETVKRKTVRPMRPVSWVFGLMGIAMMFAVHFLVGVAVVLVAALIDRPRYECGVCRNSVAEKSKMCPTCGVGLKGYD